MNNEEKSDTGKFTLTIAELEAVSLKEKLISAGSVFISVYLVMQLSEWVLSAETGALLVASLGASALILFVIPNSTFARPWPLLGGHLVSAVIGVSCALFIPNYILAAALAVGVAALVMYLLNCIHPPAGATSLLAVVGGEELHSLGYQYVLTPVAMNFVALFLLAFFINNFVLRRSYLIESDSDAVPEINLSNHKGSQQLRLTEQDLEVALKELDIYIDVTRDDLIRIYRLALKNAVKRACRTSSPKLK